MGRVDAGYVKDDYLYATELNKLIADYISQTDGVKILLDDYVIHKYSSGHYYVIDSNGKRQQDKSGLVEAIQWAHDQLSGGGSIGVRAGSYLKEWEDTLTISNHEITFHGAMGFTNNNLLFQSIDSLDKTMLSVTGKKCHIHDFTLHGNKANQATGIGIELGASSDLDIHMNNIYVLQPKQQGIKFQGGASYAHGVYVEYGDYYGWDLVGGACARNIFVQCGGYACGFNWYIQTGAVENGFYGCRGDDAPAGKDGWIIMGQKNQFHIFAVSNARYGIWIYGGQKNTLEVIVADNGDNGVYLASLGGTHALRNVIRGQIHDNGAYGIREDDANQDRNIVASGTIVTGHSTAQVSLQGANSIKSADVIEA